MAPRRDDDWFRGLSGKQVGGLNLHEFVGSGRIGHVYRGSLIKFPDAIRAVKLTFGEPRDGWDVELKKVTSLDGVEGVVHFYDLGTDNITHDGRSRLCQFTVWEFIPPGENLRKYLNRVGVVDAGFLLAVVDRVLRVLHACEKKGVPRHGDLHAGNLLIGTPSGASLDDTLQPRGEIYVSDFGYGRSDGDVKPKDDYQGLAQIINELIARVDHAVATATHRQILRSMQRDLGKLLQDGAGPERRSPLELLRLLVEIKRSAQAAGRRPARTAVSGGTHNPDVDEKQTVGQFQVSEMIGERWDWWQRLFVPSVPAGSRILTLDIPTVVTGPRGCGKTMLFRRLSERLIVECGAVAGLPVQFVALYVNANDFADAFSHFTEDPSAEEHGRLVCYANLCILGDLLTVQSARAGQSGEQPSEALLTLVHHWLIPPAYNALVVGEDRLERYRAVLEQLKWAFPAARPDLFPAFAEMSQHRWLPRFVQQVRGCCDWIGERPVLVFVDDFSTPRVPHSMQRVLNRLFLQRSPEFLAKVATEAWSTFVPEDSSGKNLQDGDDYQLVDIGEESLFLPDDDRLSFLREVFSRRLALDPRVAAHATTLGALLGTLGVTKTEFARRLRLTHQQRSPDEQVPVSGESQRRGRSRGRVLYHGEDVFANLWSGDTRTMIQLVTDVIDQAPQVDGRLSASPVDATVQDRAFRNRGGEWLNSHTRNEPTNPKVVKRAIEELRTERGNFGLKGQYGDHLKAIVEAFVGAATQLLAGPTYTIREGGTRREVPRMAFRIEIVDEFRVDGLALEIYRDLIRYGLFMRDSRGKSVRGAFVPRLYLRRLLLPYCTLALSKRDSVQMSCSDFVRLLLEPDEFKMSYRSRRAPADLPLFVDEPGSYLHGAEYDDTAFERETDESAK